MRAGRLRRAGPGRPDARHRARARSRVVDVETAQPSPFARSLLFGYVAQFLYEGDSPAGRAPGRRPRARPDPARRAARPRARGWRCATCSTPRRSPAPRPSCSGSTPERRAATPRTSLDLLRVARPAAPRRRSSRAAARAPPARATSGRWLVELEGARQVIRVRVAGEERWAAIEDAVPAARRARRLAAGRRPARPSSSRSPTRSATSSPGTPAPTARSAPRRSPRWYGLGHAVVTDALRRLVGVGPGRRGRAASRPDRRRPAASTSATPRCCGPCGGARWPRCAPRSSRSPPSSSPASCRSWQGVGGRLRGREGLVRAVEQLAGAVAAGQRPRDPRPPGPGRRLHPGPARRADGDRRGALARATARCPATTAGCRCTSPTPRHLTLAGPDRDAGAHRDATRRCSTPSPAAARTSSAPCPTRSPAGRRRRRPAPRRPLWDLVWAGPRHQRHPRAAARAARPAGAPRTAERHRAHGAAVRVATRYAGGSSAPLGGGSGRRCGPGRPSLPARTGPPAGRRPLVAAAAGRARPDRARLRDRRAAARPVRRRHPRRACRRGRCPAGSPPSTGCWPRPRRPAGCAAATSSRGSAPRSSRTTGAVDRLRGAEPAARRGATVRRRADRAVVLAASDPANPYGAALPWPDRAVDRDGRPGPATDARSRAAQQGRAAAATSPAARPGALVVLVDGELVLYVERGGKTLLTWTERPDAAAAGGRRAGPRRPRGRLGRLTVEKADGGQVLGSGHPVADGARGGRLPRHAARAAAAAVTPRCPRATPCTAPPHRLHQALAGEPVIERADLRWPVGVHVDLRGVAHPRGRQPRQASCCTGSTTA